MKRKRGTLIRSVGIKPTVMHRYPVQTYDEGLQPLVALCGAPREDWADEWFHDDEFAQSLPLCEKCAEFPVAPAREPSPEQKPIDIPSKEMTTRERELMETRMRLREMARRLMGDEC